MAEDPFSIESLRVTEEQWQRLREYERRQWHAARFRRHADRHDWRIPFETRVSVLERADEHCEYCGRRELLELHHRTYERAYGDELPEDLAALCRACHKQTHGL